MSHDGIFHTFYVTVWCSGSCLKTFQSETQNLATMESELHDKTTANVYTDPFNWPAVLQKNVYDWSTNQPTNHWSERGNSFQHITTEFLKKIVVKTNQTTGKRATIRPHRLKMTWNMPILFTCDYIVRMILKNSHLFHGIREGRIMRPWTQK